MVLTVSEVLERAKFWKNADRIGPDIPLTHWRLHFKSSMRALCKAKFKRFADTAEFRPGAYAVACSRISIGERVAVRPGTMLFADEYEGITIDDDVLIGCGVHVYTNNHAFADPSVRIIDQGYTPSLPVHLKCGSWIGANAIVLEGVTVGENAVVAAGSVVTKNVPDRVVVGGVPARVLRTIGANDHAKSLRGHRSRS